MEKKRVLALGFFDGIHIGHGALLRRAVAVAEERGATPAILTFDTHPDGVIGGTPVPLLNSGADREYIARRFFGVNEVILMHFTPEFMRMNWERFVEDVVAARYNACHVVAGHDFRFGYRGEGNTEKLTAKCAELGIGCDIIPKVELDGTVVSSTYIRELIARGDMEEACRFLGHPHVMSGTVLHGRKLGRTIGVPTINMRIPDGVLPPKFGVYSTRVHLDGETWLGVTNVGVRPTVDRSAEPAVSVETYVLDFDRQIYGRQARLDFHAWLRPEQKFRDVKELADTIMRNGEETRRLFAMLDKS